MTILRTLLLMLFTTILLPVNASEKPFVIKPLAEDLEIVWGMDFLDETNLIFTQRSGQAGLLNIQTGLVTWLKGLPEVHNENQGGLLDVKAAPNYAQTGWVYFTYSKPTVTSAVTTLARATLAGNKLLNWQDLLVTQSESFKDIHFGSRIAFDDQDHVFSV